MGRIRVTSTLAAVGVAGIVAALALPAAPAFADSQPFEEYCPGTPVGDIALNNAVVTGSLSPASPASGQQFNLTNFQATINLPTSLAAAAAALGNTAITGSAVATVDVAGASPGQIKSGALPINVPIPSPVPPSGLNLQLPGSPSTIGPFTASGGQISVTLDQSAQISVTVSGSSLNLTCTAYPNNSVASGVVTAKPSAQPVSPVIATAGSSGGSAPAAPTSTSSAPASSPTSGGTTPTTPTTAASAPAIAPQDSPSMAFTGPGPHLWLTALIGFVVLCLGVVALGLTGSRRRARMLGAAGGGDMIPLPHPRAGRGHPVVRAAPVARDNEPDSDLGTPGALRHQPRCVDRLWVDSELWQSP